VNVAFCFLQALVDYGGAVADQHQVSQIRWATWATVFVAVILFAIKFYAFRLTGSQAIFSEAMETVVNIIAAVVTLGVVRLSVKPADREHPYGHGKVEYLSAALEGGLIAFAAFVIVIEALQALVDKSTVQRLDFGLVLMAGTAIINLAMGFYLRRLGQKHQSPALEASGAHLMADFWTTAGVVTGLLIVVWTDVIWLDTLIALLVGAHLAKEGYVLIRKSLAGLLDEEEEGLIHRLRELINQSRQPGIIQVHHLRMIRAGRFHHIDAHVVVPEFWSVDQAHDQTKNYEQKIFADYQFGGEFHFHVDPCRRLYCQYCDLKDCPVRQTPFQSYRDMSIEELTAKDEPSDITQ
jgi:cation diffusion facilitator family transporter